MFRSLDIQSNPDRRGRRILIVDDEPTLRFGLAYALADDSTVVDTASNGAEALERFGKFSYDAVVLDLRMPEVDGLAVIEKMRSEGLHTPVILCSSFMTLHSALPAIMHQVADFLMKPVSPQELRKAVAAALGNDRSLLGKALSAVRRSQYDEAIDTLEACQVIAGESEKAWLKVLRSLRTHHFDVRTAESELENPLIEFLVVQGEA